MLSQALLAQLREHFAGLGSRYALLLNPSDHAKYAELESMLTEVAETSPQLQLQKGTKKADTLHFTLLKDGEPTNIHFNGIPGGHEFTSLVLAILNADGKGRLPDPALQERVRKIKGPLNLRTIVSLSCTNCPDVVQAMNQITLIHPDCNHTMVDGDLIPEELQQLGIQGVPTVLDGTAIVHVGKAGFGELLETLEARFGVHEAPRDGVLGEPQVFDQIVIGGGPAGISAAVYSARKGLRVALVAQRIGGQVNDTQGIENLISVPHTEGARLSADLRAHAKAYPISLLEHRRVISLQTRDLHRVKEVHLQGGEILEAPQVIIATGAAWRELGVPGEKEHIGKGVAFCPHCDGPFFKGKDVAVVGGGNSGIEAAIDLAGLARNVTVFEFADTLKADKVLVDKAQSLPNVSIHTSARTTEVVAKGGSVSGIRWEDRRDGALKEQALDGIFVQIGLVPQTALFSPLVESNKAGEIVVDSHGRTSVPGIYAAGDCATVPFKQIVVAMGSGATAALSAFEDRMRGV